VQSFAPEVHHLNDSVGVNPTFSAKVFYLAASSILPLRRLFGMQHLPHSIRQRLLNLRAKFLKAKKIHVVENPQKDEQIRRFFSESYACMRSISASKVGDRLEKVTEF
jgi:hypothetical protein